MAVMPKMEVTVVLKVEDAVKALLLVLEGCRQPYKPWETANARLATIQNIAEEALKGACFDAQHQSPGGAIDKPDHAPAAPGPGR